MTASLARKIERERERDSEQRGPQLFGYFLPRTCCLLCVTHIHVPMDSLPQLRISSAHLCAAALHAVVQRSLVLLRAEVTLLRPLFKDTRTRE